VTEYSGPKYDELMNPLLEALRELGGSGSNDEITKKVAELLKLPEEITSVPHNPETSSQTELGYRLAWARTYLKKYGLLQNSERGVWTISPDKRNVLSVDPREVVKAVRGMFSEDVAEAAKSDDNGETEDIPEESRSWRRKLHQLLTNDLSPDAFERLAKRILRESGFVQVEVTGKSNDGGIDGKGIIRLGGLLSFHVVFQCKRYKGSVSASQIRDFRGAFVGRADKGLFITTGTFTSGAIQEATRDGAPPIDLVDGDDLTDKLKELGLGVKTEMVERVLIDESWFKTI
jgi:restriction system protein